MKKRLLASLMALCLLAGLLPITVFAGGVETVKTYDELVAKIEELTPAESSQRIALDPAENFGWPASGTLTLPAKIGIDCNSKWEIPNNITVLFEPNSGGISCSELLINGTIRTSYSSQDSIFIGCGKVVIGPTGTFSCTEDHAGQQTICGQRIAPGKTWEVLEGGTLNARIRLGGTLTGAGTVSGQVDIQGGFSGTSETEAVLSGNLAVTGMVNVGCPSSWNSQWEDIQIGRAHV